MGHRHTDYVSDVLKDQDGFENSILKYNRESMSLQQNSRHSRRNKTTAASF